MHDSRMKKILSKKRDLSPMEHSAKMDVVKHMRDMASEEMGGKLDGLKKVSVMSNSPQGLKHGLDKAKHIVSNMDQMKNHAENDMGDDLAARQEHMNDESNHDDGSEASFSEGGQVDPMQSAQDSMRKAFGYNEGGEVEESPDEDNSEEGYESREESEDEDPTSPEEEQEESPESEASESEDDEFHGLDMDQLKDKLREMMQMHKSMGKK